MTIAGKKKVTDKMYRIVIEENNGYTCACCRETWKTQEQMKTMRDVVSFLEDFLVEEELGNKENIEILYVEEIGTSWDAEDLIDRARVDERVAIQRKADEYLALRRSLQEKQQDKIARRRRYLELKKEFEK